MRPARTSLVVFTSSQVSTVVGFIATFYIARFLGPATLGMYAVITAMLFWLHVPASAIDSAVTKRISEGFEPGEFLTAGILMNGGLAVLVALGILLFDKQVHAYVGAPISITVAFLVVSWFAAKAVTAALQGQNRVAASSIVWTSGRVVRTTAQIALTLLLSLGLAGLVWGHTISFVVVTIVGVAIFDIRPRLPSKAQFRSLLEYARYSWLGQISSQAFNWMDTVLLAFFVSSTLIGIYEVAWTIASTLGIVSTAITQTLFPSMSSLDARDERDEVAHLLNEGLVFAGFFAIPGLFGALVIGPRVLEVFGSAFSQGSLILLILIVARLANSFSSQLKNTMNAVDRPDLGFRINAVFITANLVLNLSLIPIFGWFGAAAATASSSILALLMSYYYTESVLGGVTIPTAELGFETIASIGMMAVVYGLSRMVPPSEFTTIALVGVGAVAYLVIVLGISSKIRSKLSDAFLPVLHS